ncbi:nucleotide sugar dehydrogenase [Polynucleobacter sp. AP-Elch-400A-B2]|uniref:nucleotide sugar dehydrogenase n=1 Tax=Polynucleobacter sp. AP-Elch-400A-B2 TaxID=2576930 RepID=UPI001BFEDBD1|nr:nucleotide sugar dehydrogenase [Polynucleobacter sp. AP-Elch-400A-B2]QWE24986.1 nucleotide sugar dehydrogenase [Polynucleobacter sp. AP-Elch-400A-B2]
MDNIKIAIIGLGYVGLPLAVEFGKKIITVGFDIDPERIGQLILLNDKNNQTSSSEILDSKFLKFTSSENDLSSANIYIITVPTPVDKFNRPDLSLLTKASALVAKYLKKNDIVIYESTVYPGCTEEVCVPVLESNNSQNLKYNQDFFCGYSPERINPGDKNHTLISIRKITSGSTAEIADLINNLYLSIIKAGTYKASSIKVAEAAKVIENSQRDINIAFMNELSIIFNLLDIDTKEVLQAASTKWNFLPFTPGLVGGHCIGVDPYYLTHKAQELGYKSEIILSGRRINDNMPAYVASKIAKGLVTSGYNLSKSSVGVLGITFKEDCSDIRNSKSIELVQELKTWGINVLVSDPLAEFREVKNSYGIELGDFSSWANLSALVIAVPHENYYSLSPHLLSPLFAINQKPFLADLKSIFDRNIFEENGFKVFRL